MKHVVYIFIFCCSLLKAQDKLFLKNGTRLNCKIVSLNLNTIDYKDSASASLVLSIEKTEVLMAEYKTGETYIFGSEPTWKKAPVQKTRFDRDNAKRAAIQEKEKDFKDNILGFQPIDIVWGRLTFTYERLFMNKRMGVTIPFSLTYDPRILIPNSSSDTIVNTREQVRHNTGFITGLDLNYYQESKSHTKFFFGPRFRYGQDVNLANITAYTIQFQQGFLLCDSKGRLATTVAVGFGFARIISTPFSSAFNEKQSYPWASFTLRLGIRR